MTGMLPLTERQSWKALQAHRNKIPELHLRTLFVDDATRGERLTAEAVICTIPVGPLTARIRLPEGARPAKVQLLTLGKTVAADLRNGVLRVTVPTVDTHEVIAIDF